MERNGINVQVIVENKIGAKNTYNGKVMHFGPDGSAVVVYTEGPLKTMFANVPLCNLRAILDDKETD